jgi:predicted transcriptional regulator
MKTAVSLPADLHRRADRLAKRTHKSRSRLYAEALEQYLQRHDADEISEALNAVYAGDADRDDALAQAVAATLGQSEW